MVYVRERSLTPANAVLLVVALLTLAVFYVQPLAAPVVPLVMFLADRRAQLLGASIGAILLVSFSPDVISASATATTLQKALALGGIGFAALILGLRRGSKAIWLVYAWTATLVLSLKFAHRVPGLTSSTMIRAWAGYSFAWLALYVRWEKAPRYWPAKMIAWLPVFCVAFGFALQVTTGRGVLRPEFTGVNRLEGSLIPAHLAMVGFVGMGAALWLQNRKVKRMWLLVAADLGVTFATGTRGASAAMVLMLLVVLIRNPPKPVRTRSAYRPTVPKQQSQAGRRALLLSVLAVFLVLFVPVMLQRSAANSYETGGNTSGRTAAWSFYWSDAKTSLTFGRGLGAGSIDNTVQAPAAVQAAFSAPHNTYLQIILDGGIAGAVLVFLALRAMYRTVKRRADPMDRPLLAGLLLGTLVYAVVDNLLTTPQFDVPFAILLAIIASGKQSDIGHGGLSADGASSESARQVALARD